MDNSGLYITYSELILELLNSGSTKVTKSDVTLSNKAIDAGGDIYEYSVPSGAPTPNIGDIILQAGYTDCIVEIISGPDRLRIEKTGPLNQIQNGPANILHSDSVTKARAISLIQLAMAKIDRDTGQFFNLRSGIFQIEGSNSPILFFNVPIIEIRELKINGTDQVLIEGRDYDFLALKGRIQPQDDRWNPRIKLNTRTDNIFSGVFTNRIFLKDTFTEIDGDFGFLEPDGSTPPLIKRAAQILVIEEIENPISSSASNPTTGSLKRLKIDLHEQEFFEPKDQNQAFGASANDEYNRIVAQYKRPLLIGGSFREAREDRR